MSPLEIWRFSRLSPELREALKEHRGLWAFLRTQVIARYRYYPHDQHKCERCTSLVYPTLKSPYNSFHPGWCIDCVIHGYLTDMPLYRTPQEIEDERKWEPPEVPEGYPPIAWS